MSARHAARRADPSSGSVLAPSGSDDLVRSERDGGVGVAFRPALDAGEALLRHMVRARVVSARMVALQRSEKIGSHHASLGEEAAIVGAVARDARDRLDLPGAREWYAALARGLPLGAYVHHAFGSAEDPTKGHAAPDHAPARAVHVVPPSGVIGAHLPQAVGAAWAAKIEKASVATLALFGAEVAANGDFHNALNFGGVFKAPVVFVCRAKADARIVDRAVAYGLASARRRRRGCAGRLHRRQGRARSCDRGEGAHARRGRVPVARAGHGRRDRGRRARLGRRPRPRSAPIPWRVSAPCSRERSASRPERRRRSRAEVRAELDAAVDRGRARGRSGAGDHLRTTCTPAFPAHLAAERQELTRSAEEGRVDGRGSDEHGPGHQRRAPPRDAARRARRRARRGRRQGRRRLPRHAGPVGRVRRRPRRRHAALRGRHHRHRHRHGALRPACRCPRSSSPTSSIPAYDQIVSELAKLRWRSGGEYPAKMVVRTPVGGGIRGGLYHSQSPESLFIHVAGPQGRVPEQPARREGPAARVDPRSRTRCSSSSRSASTAPPRATCPRATTRCRSARPPIVREGKRRHGPRLGRDALRGRRRRRRGDEAGDRVRDRRSPHALAGRHRHHRREREKTGRVVVVHEAPKTCGFGAELVALVNEKAFLPPRGAAGARLRLRHAVPLHARDGLPASRAPHPAGDRRDGEVLRERRRPRWRAGNSSFRTSARGSPRARSSVADQAGRRRRRKTSRWSR